MRERAAPLEKITGRKGRNIIKYKSRARRGRVKGSTDPGKSERAKREIEERKKPRRTGGRTQVRGQGHKRVRTNEVRGKRGWRG